MSRSAHMKLALMLALSLLVPSVARAQAGIADDILALTGGKQVRMVWMRDTGSAGDAVFGNSNSLRLIGYDTDDDTIRVIMNTLDDYTKPLLTRDGGRIVYTDRLERKIYMVNWDGSGRVQLASGYGGAVWQDPGSGKQWVYYQDGGEGGNASNPIRRVNIDNSSEKELVWNATDNNMQWIAISADGARIAGSWPWSVCGNVAPSYDGSGGGAQYHSGNGYYTSGCWVTTPPDNTYRQGVFDGPHRAWKVWDWPTGSMRTLDLHSAPGINGWEIYHPKHSNHPRFITMTGPYSVGSMGANNIRAGGPQVEAYFGMTDAGFTQVNTWIRVTNDGTADFFPDAWVNPQAPNTVRVDSFVANPSTVTEGQSSTLSWTTTNASSVSINQSIGTVNADDSTSVSPTSTTTYTLTAEGEGGPVTRQATVTVAALALDRLVVQPQRAVIMGGESIAFSVSAYDQVDDPIAVVFDWSVNGGGSVSPTTSGAAQTTHSSTFTSDGSAGDFMVRVSANGVSVDVPVTVWPSGPLHLRINCGDGTPAVAGWDDEDPYRTGGSEYDFTGTVDTSGASEPAPSDVYLTCAHLAHSYSFPVPDGAYTVRLHFFDGHGGDRAMDYTIEGVLVLDDFNITAAAGGAFRAHVEEFAVVVADGDGLQIDAALDQGNDAFESGIEIIAATSTDDQDPTISISAPADGATVSGDLQVEGSAADNSGVARVELQVDGGSWELAAGTASWSHTLYTTILSDGAHTITARASDAAGNTATASVDINTDNAPTIDITRPAGGETWISGDVENIEWSTHNLDNVSIFFSLDGGSTFAELAQTVFDTDPEWGAFPWTVPSTTTDQALIRIQGYFGEVPTDTSTFTIQGPPQTLTMSAPQAGETHEGGTTLLVEWTAENVESVELDYTLDGGATWSPIQTVSLTDTEWGACPWTLPNVSSQLAEVRARSPGGGAEDLSGPFTIVPGQIEAGAVELTRLVLGLEVPAQLTSVEVEGQIFPVSAGLAEVSVAVPNGVESLIFEISGGDYSRVVSVALTAAEPAIPGLGVSAAQLRSFFGGRAGMLVWVDAGGSVQKLDFRGADPGVETLVNGPDCVNPIISRDGTRLLYSQGPANGPKTIWIRSLDASGSPAQAGIGDVAYWHTDSGGFESVIYCDWSDKLENGADGQTYQRALVTGDTSFSADAAPIHDRAMDAGPNGELSWLGQVYNNLWAHDLSRAVDYGTDRFFLMDGSAADHQTCNGSMAPDSSGRIMALVIPHDWVRVYSYVSERDRFEETSRFELPGSMVEWEFPEWSTDPEFFSAVLMASDYRNRLFVVKMAEGDVVPELLEVSGETGEVSYSHLWLEP